MNVNPIYSLTVASILNDSILSAVHAINNAIQNSRVESNNLVLKRKPTLGFGLHLPGHSLEHVIPVVAVVTTASQPTHTMSKVVIVGGGYAGVNLAKILDKDFEVTIIEKHDKFNHNLAALRGAVQHDWSPKTFIGYDRLLRNGKVIQGTVKSIDANSVHLESSTGESQVLFDFLVLATGYKWPLFVKNTDSAQGIAVHKKTSTNIAAAEHILIVGGGAVGCETAGEIRFMHPNKKITIVHSGQELIGPGYKPSFYKKMNEKMQALNIEVVRGDRVTTTPPADGFDETVEKRTYSTQSGKTIEADFSMWCTGGTPNTAFLREFLESSLLPTGHVKVEPTLQIPGHSNVFAMGDIAALEEGKLAYFTKEHANTVANNIRVLRKGGNKLKEYKPQSVVVLIPLGPRDGASQLPFGVVGGTITSMIKGKKLMVEDQWGVLNRKGLLATEARA